MKRICDMVLHLRDMGMAMTALAAAGGLVSCEKVVAVDLGPTEPQIVVQGVVTDRWERYFVVLNKTADYFARSAVFPPVSRAVVIITEQPGTADTLRELGDGVYYSRILHGTPGRSYALSVAAEGRSYSAMAVMPPRVPIIALAASSAQRPDGSTGFDVEVKFRDPPEQGNYYRLELRSRIRLMDTYKWHQFILYNDRLANGNEVSYNVRLDKNAAAGDSVIVDLISLDRGAYEYFSGLNEILASAENPTPLSPANPASNLSNGSLGYFAACAIDTKGIRLK